MEKALVLIVSVLAILGVGSAVSACEEIDFDSYGTICVDLVKDGSTYDLDVDYNDLSLSYSNAYFYVLLPNRKSSSKTSGGGMLSPRLTSSNSEFSYNYKTYNGYDSASRFIKVYAIIGNEVRSTEVYYDFSNGDRGDGGTNSSSSNSNGDLDNFYITLSDSTPAKNDEVTLTVKARNNSHDTLSDYDGSNADVKIEYRSSSSSSRKNATSTYVSIDDTTPQFNNGVAKTNVTFKYNYEYRITVADDSEDIEDTKIFDVGGSSSSNSNGDLDNFYITLSDSTPVRNNQVTLRVKARDTDNNTIDDYNGRNADITVEYRSSSSSSWKPATSSYAQVGDKNPYFSIGYASTNITFKYNYQYRITVTDDSEDIDANATFDVGGSSSSSSNGDLDNFYVTTNDSKPDTNELVDLTIKARDSSDDTITDYTDSVDFKVYYRKTSTAVWTPTTSSTYYQIDSDYNNGYDFSSSDDGIATLDNFIKFKQKRQFKVVVEDSNDADLNGYTVFNLRNQDSDIDGFTVSQLEAVKTIYDGRNKMISNLKSDYPKLKSNNTRIQKSDDMYNNMGDVIDDASNREFDTYSDYLNAFRDRYQYTIDHR